MAYICSREYIIKLIIKVSIKMVQLPQQFLFFFGGILYIWVRPFCLYFLEGE